MTIAERVRQTLRRKSGKHQRTVDTKLRAIAKASRHEFPTADIEDMLRKSSRDDERRPGIRPPGGL
ncbi:MAG: hypothetical protein OXG43_08540 [Chloroflexi bacterium]|nr:hypothetical protein [Chloroflexota bacterium]